MEWGLQVSWKPPVVGFSILIFPLLIFKYLLYGYSPTDVYMHHVHAWYPQKPEGELDLQKQELQMVVSHQEDAVNQGTVVCKNSEHSNPLSSHLSS